MESAIRKGHELLGDGNLRRIARDFGMLANRFERFAAQDVKLPHIARNVVESKIRAARLLIEAIDAGAFPESRKDVSGDWWNRSTGRVPGMFLSVYESFRWREGDPPPHKQPEYLRRVAGEWSPDQLVLLWPHVICSWLQRRFPNRFRHDAAQCDWGHLATNNAGRLIGKDGRPLKALCFKDGEPLPDDFNWKNLEPGHRYSSRLDGEVCYIESSFDEADWIALERVRAEVYADACLLLSELIGDAVIQDPVADGEFRLDELVSLSQVAPLTGKSKRTLERYVKDSKLPQPDFRGGEGKSNKWYWRTLQPALSKQFDRIFPSRFPGSSMI